MHHTDKPVELKVRVFVYKLIGYRFEYHYNQKIFFQDLSGGHQNLLIYVHTNILILKKSFDFFIFFYFQGNMHRSHFRNDLVYTKRKGSRESFPDYQPPMDRRCSIYYDENDVFSDNPYQEAGRQKNTGDNLNNIQINFMLISPEKLEVSLTLDNQRFSGKLFCVS